MEPEGGVGVRLGGVRVGEEARQRKQHRQRPGGQRDAGAWKNLKKPGFPAELGAQGS